MRCFLSQPVERWSYCSECLSFRDRSEQSQIGHWSQTEHITWGESAAERRGDPLASDWPRQRLNSEPTAVRSRDGWYTQTETWRWYTTKLQLSRRVLKNRLVGSWASKSVTSSRKRSQYVTASSSTAPEVEQGMHTIVIMRIECYT